jgi:hypothetical protein
MGLGTKNPFMTMPSQLGQDVSAAHQGLGWMDYPLSAAAYAVGPGKVFGPAGKAISEAGSALPGLAGKVIGGAGGAIGAEGALAGGTSAAIADPTNPMGVLEGAGTGYALGRGAGALTGGVNAGLQKAFGAPGSIDSEAAIAATKTTRDALYGKLQNIPVGANSLKNAYASATLTPGMAADVSPGFNTLIGRQLEQVNQGGITANDVADFAKNLRAGATSNGDQILAGKISDNLISALPSEAQQTLQAANEAHQQYMMAQNLGKWGRITGEGGSIGQAPLTEAENFYSDDPEKYKILAGLANQSQGHSPATYALGHLAANVAGAVGGGIAGFPGMAIGETLGYMYARPAIYKAMKGVDRRANIRAIQQAYPQMTGQPLTGAQPGPQIGDAIKNLMLGSAY